MGPMLSVVLSVLLFSPLTNVSFVFVISAISFLIALYSTTPKIINYVKIDSSKVATKFIFRTGLALLFLKLIVLITASGGIPIFSEGGSDAYIEFDINNKLTSTLLLGVGRADLVLFAFLLPLVKWRWTCLLIHLFFLISVLLCLFSGKKAGIISIFLAVALG
jgi:hypothetical protein